VTAPVFEDASPIELDTIPPVEDVEYPCRNCGREAGPYSGRGRKPTLCPDCKPSTRKTSGANRRTTNDALAAQASAVLEQLNGVLAIGAMALGFNMTASAIAGNNEAFKENAFEALKTDPDLCKLICKGGVKSGKVALGIAYASFGTQVVPVAVSEYKMKREERRMRMEAMEDENVGNN
jgi:hypothetical protein